MSNTEYSNHDLCFLARVTIEARTPMRVGTGCGSVAADVCVDRDVNGLPFVPATTIKGLLRHAMPADVANRMMGWRSDSDVRGSWLSLSEARMVGPDGGVVDGMIGDIAADPFLSGFAAMPIRQHVRLTHWGVAADKAKFDEEVVPKGVRFCFEMELRADEAGQDDFLRLLDALRADTFRIGGGSRRGFGQVRVVDVGFCRLDFNVCEDFLAYASKSASMASPWERYRPMPADVVADTAAVRYELRLSPVDFVFFSSGMGDERSDMSVVKEAFVRWDADGRPMWCEAEQSVVVPAASVKGAVSHRVAFHNNVRRRVFADLLPEGEAEESVGKNNPAVLSLFGSEGEREGGKTVGKRRGRVLFSDVVRRRVAAAPKCFNHVRVDRFTGGAVDGALFGDEPLYAADELFCLSLTLLPGKEAVPDAVAALEEALKDVCSGALPLGGGVNRGYGRFRGWLLKDGKVIYDYEQD